MLTVIRLGLFDHTLDGIFDVVGLFLFDGLLSWHFVTKGRVDQTSEDELTLPGRTS